LIKPSLAPAVIFIALISEWAFIWRMAVVWAVAAGLSLLLLGWGAHVSFVKQMLESLGWEYSWYYNSSIYVALDVLRARALTWVLKTIVILTLAWFAWQTRGSTWTVRARRHFCFLLMMVFSLVWSPTVYEHYLSLLFPFLIFIIVSAPSFSRQALTLVALIFVFSLAQNLIVVNWIRYGLKIDSLPELLLVALVKSAPLLLTMGLMWRHRGELQAAGQKVS
jgi:hypothetical protein